jgi:hypothetical protein
MVVYDLQREAGVVAAARARHEQAGCERKTKTDDRCTTKVRERTEVH